VKWLGIESDYRHSLGLLVSSQIWLSPDCTCHTLMFAMSVRCSMKCRS